MDTLRLHMWLSVWVACSRESGTPLCDPLAVVAVQSLEDAKHFFWLSIVSCRSLFPLLYQAQEYPIKVLLLLLSTILMFTGFSALFDADKASEASKASALGKGGQSKKSRSTRAKKRGFAFGWTVRAYLLGIIIVELWGQFLYPYLFGDKFPFMPIMMVSVYCAFGIVYSWIWQMRSILVLS
ncbi:hypothetical protein MLD38_021279 [Melastoma candidum]|uniref:Uncharacterized protein n=1 Tax=Melastoma candidum TaxID=119954 RepID=A0ACB9QEU6_9MYRT|nr:hypothetical protein MLD38_021279 [Melastoma candidum]